MCSGVTGVRRNGERRARSRQAKERAETGVCGVRVQTDAGVTRVKGNSSVAGKRRHNNALAGNVMSQAQRQPVLKSTHNQCGNVGVYG